MPTLDFSTSVPLISPTIPGWRLIKELGSGDFSTVWLGERLGQRAAIKVLHPKHRREVSLLEESEILFAINHPGVVRPHTTGEQHFVMDYIEGPELAADMQAGKIWSFAETIELIGHLCDALSAVHDAGFIHHDVNAGNIMLGPRPILVDFGWGAAIGSTRNRVKLNNWCSPESFRRRLPSVLDDLWPIPLMTEVMLTGRSPLFGPQGDVYLSLLGFSGFRRPRKDPRLPQGFNRWYLKATNPDSTKRYQSAEELKQGLLRLSS